MMNIWPYWLQRLNLSPMGALVQRSPHTMLGSRTLCLDMAPSMSRKGRDQAMATQHQLPRHIAMPTGVSTVYLSILVLHPHSSIRFIHGLALGNLNTVLTLKHDDDDSGVHLPGVGTIVTLSGYYPFEDGTDQYAFFLSTVKNLDRENHPWLIVTIHAPFYLTLKVSRSMCGVHLEL